MLIKMVSAQQHKQMLCGQNVIFGRLEKSVTFNLTQLIYIKILTYIHINKSCI